MGSSGDTVLYYNLLLQRIAYYFSSVEAPPLADRYTDETAAATRQALDGSNTVIGSFMCQGKMPVSVRQRYEAMKAKPLHIPNLDTLIENFDKALSHPDAADLEQLKQAVK